MNSVIKLYSHQHTVQLKSIKVNKAFRATTPSTDKVVYCEQFYLKNGFFDRDIIINQNGYIMDGYIAYLVAKAHNVEKIKVIQIVPKLIESKPFTVTAVVRLTLKERLLGKHTQEVVAW